MFLQAIFGQNDDKSPVLQNSMCGVCVEYMCIGMILPENMSVSCGDSNRVAAICVLKL